MEPYIKKSAVVAEIEKIREHVKRLRYAVDANCIVTVRNACECLDSSIDLLVNSLDTLEVKEVNIAEMADDYYDALMKEAADWMNEGTMGHCRLAYYTGCKRACLEKRGEQKPADSYCQENCKGFQETGKCFADGECKAKREAEQNLAENAKPQSSTPMSYGKELEKRMYEACNRFFAPNTDSNRYSASDLFYAGVKAERDLNTLAWSEGVK